jgi:hypothetical protein
MYLTSLYIFCQLYAAKFYFFLPTAISISHKNVMTPADNGDWQQFERHLLALPGTLRRNLLPWKYRSPFIQTLA